MQTTPVYDLYWRFAVERQEIFFRRVDGQAPNWTDDAILQHYKFTNAYRASDRASQFLIRNVIYSDAYPSVPNEVVFRILLFKFFNKIETWRALEAELGLLTWQSFDVDRYDRALKKILAAGASIYSAAYIIPPVALSRTGIKHQGHLALLEFMLKGDFVARLQQTASLLEVYQLLKSYPSLGSFLGYQLAIDLNYSEVISHRENDYVVAGPGALDGLAKTFVDAQGVDPCTLIEFMMERQEFEFKRLGLAFKSLWGRRLQLIDCQNLFCEISKYTRISHPKIMGISGRTRIKQLFRPKMQDTLVPWYPPKWGLNARIANQFRLRTRIDEGSL